MAGTITEQILSDHLVDGTLTPGQEIGLEADQVLLQDTLGTMTWLQFEALDLDQVSPDTVVQYCDHQSYQFDFKNTDDHAFLRSATDQFGAWYSSPGNGVCHQVHFEHFARPGELLLGGDSHTPTQGGLGMFAIGAGGLDVAVAMGGSPYYLDMPEIVEVRLEGALPEWSTAKDVILELLRRLSVKGGVDKVFEYTGPGVESLEIPERCTLTNMGTELGATSSIFPTDAVTRDYLRRLGREDEYVELSPKEGASYHDQIVINLSKIEPLIATPSMPDKVVPVREVAGTEVDQVIIGSCTNGGYEDIKAFAETIDGEFVDQDVHGIIQPASKQATEMLARDGTVADMMAAGINWSEATCGACCGVGHVPGSDSVSLRTFNRNFQGRSGLENDRVFLASPQVAAAAAVEGEIIDPREYGSATGIDDPGIVPPDHFTGNVQGLISPTGGQETGSGLEKGPNIGEVPVNEPLPPELSGSVLLKVGDDITTDHISPASSEVLMYRSNISKLSEFTFAPVDSEFATRAEAADGGFVVAGENYGQGSSREHAALCPMYLGVDGVIGKSFARIHKANLMNFGLLPLTFQDPADYDRINPEDKLSLLDVRSAVGEATGLTELIVRNKTQGIDLPVQLKATDRERDYLLAGGRLPYARQAHGSN